MSQQPSIPSTNYTYQSAFLLLPTGQLLCSAQTNTLFLFTPSPADESPDPSWRPANISISATLVPGQTYSVTGTQINGLSQAVSYGDDGGMATNYPIVRIKNNKTGHVKYCKTQNHSSMGVATGSTVQSTDVVVPGDIEYGESELTVIANGIPSLPVSVNVTISKAVANAIAELLASDGAVIIAGVIQDGGGIVRLPNGQIIRIPPGDPVWAILSPVLQAIAEGLAAGQETASASNTEEAG
jgi:hypothetical protein